jgi:shikimate dehydrogenase
MGMPVAGNPTQYMMEKAFAKAGLDWRYLTLEVLPEHLEQAILGMRAMGFRGANFTIPHKVAVIQYLDDLSEAARLMGAVNCVTREGDRLVGENTDGKGFLQSLRDVADPAGKRVVVIGAGGAARAIAVELGMAGAAEITVVNRTESQGALLVDLLRDKVHVPVRLERLQDDYAVPPAAEILINATSVGLGNAEARLPIAFGTLRPDLVVADVVFNPPETRLLRDAKARGCTTLDGLGMLVNQAVIGFQIWTHTSADAGVMREALEEFLGL